MTGEKERREPNLENSLRGTGDLGAMADCVYCILCSDKKIFRAEIVNVKARDFEPPESFEILGRPHLDMEHDLKLVRAPNISSETLDMEEAVAVCQAIERNPNATHRQLADVCGVSKNKIRKLALSAGWMQVDGKGAWQRRNPKTLKCQ